MPVFSEKTPFPPSWSFVLFCTVTLCSSIFLLLLVHILRTVLITQDSLFRFLEPSSGPGMWPVLSREQLAWCIAVSLCTLFLSECVDLDTCRKLPWRDPVSLAVTKYFCFFGNVCHFILGSENPKALYHNDLKVLFKQAFPSYFP